MIILNVGVVIVLQMPLHLHNKNVYVCTDGYRNDENSHGWTEINGRVYDPLFAEAKSYSRNYGVRYGVYPLSPVMRVKIA